MGSYLSSPVTEKVSNDELNNKLICGASSMQGWRVSQEDAHNCILDFDTNASLFAVYDGHGGHEVAQYCSKKLPDFIKNTSAYKEGHIEQALIDGFLEFDATIATPAVVDILKEIAGEKEADEESYEEEVHNLYEEATMPIEQVIEKYTNLVNPTLKALKSIDGDKLPKSPFLKAHREPETIVDSVSSNSSEAGCSKSSDIVEECSSTVSNNDKVSSSSSNGENVTGDIEEKDDKIKESEQNGAVPEIKITNADSSDNKNESSPSNNETPKQNGDILEDDKKVSSSSTQNNGAPSPNKGKGKALLKTKLPKANTRPKRNATQLYKSLLDFGHDSEDDTDEEDKTFEGPAEDSEDEEDNVNVPEEEESSSEETEEEGGDDDEEEDDNDEDLEFARNMKEEPGSDSGCTAVVALLKGAELYVANAGDSRCIVCRNGKAIEMSFDHKPEDEPERDRIIKAGGKVTSDGRVNGGLNLSRAIGDHAYKQNKSLSDKEQMITALPDIKTLTIKPEDEFMVLACDGIWNFMSSQEVVDFVRPRLEANSGKLSQICEEMFDHCLAPNTVGDGTGCDNMTAIVVKFMPNILKRAASPDLDVGSKRARTEETDETTSSEEKSTA